MLPKAIYICIFQLILALAFTASCYAQTTIDTVVDDQQQQAKKEERKRTVMDLLAMEKNNRDSILNGNNLLSTSDPRLDSFELESWKSYYTYINTGYKHRTKVFAWQLASSYVIFFIVIFLVLCGIYFAWLQFKVALKQMQKQHPNAATALASELSASPRELKVSSPVLGVIILVLSLLFFYLYLVHVYPITESF